MTQINGVHSSVSKGSNLNEPLLPIKRCSCLFPTTTSPPLAAYLKGRCKCLTEWPTWSYKAHALLQLLSLQQDSAVLPPSPEEASHCGMGKISVKVQGKEQQHKTTIVLGMAIFKHTANRPVCKHTVNGRRNILTFASVEWWGQRVRCRPAWDGVTEGCSGEHVQSQCWERN